VKWSRFMIGLANMLPSITTDAQPGIGIKAIALYHFLGLGRRYLRFNHLTRPP